MIILKIGFVKEKFPTKKLRRKNPREGQICPSPGQLGLMFATVGQCFVKLSDGWFVFVKLSK